MNLSAAALRVMLAKGLTLGDVADIAEANEKRSDPTNALRQARHRAKVKAEGERNGVTVTGVTPPNDIDILIPQISKKSEPKGSSKKDPFVLPEDIPAEPWDGWVEMRKGIGKSPGPRACALAVSELRRLRDDEGWPPGVVLNHCTMNSYQGIFPPKRGQSNERSSNPTAEAAGRILRELRANDPANQDPYPGGSHVDVRGPTRALAARRD